MATLELLLRSSVPYMITDLIQTFLVSISPFGEARVGIPYGVVLGLHPLWAFVVGLGANLLVYPIFKYLLDNFDTKLWKFRPYKRQSIKLARRAKSGVGAKIQRYGFWGLMLFVMIPLPITGAYMGTIASHVFRIRRRKAFAAISIGVIISCSIMATAAHLGKAGAELI